LALSVTDSRTRAGGRGARKGNIKETGLTEVGYDQDYHFLLAEIVGKDLYFQAVRRTGETLEA
jgi:hypothetical protein